MTPDHAADPGGRAAASTGDMSPEEFRREAHRLADWIAEYFAHPEQFPVLAQVHPGEIASALPSAAPEQGDDMSAIVADFERVLVPGLTHWNHPGFFAYFAITASGPGILADLLSSALNQQAMLWRTSPAATELEAVALGWLRQMLGLPEAFEGVIYDTASVSSLHALAAAREAAVVGVREHGLSGRDVPPLSVYCSEHAHSSIDKAVILLGLGHASLRKIPADAEFRLRPDALAAAIADDRRAGRLPVAVVATVGTTSTTSVDPVPEIADICERERMWLHVDAAYGGAAALVPGWEWVMRGCDRADSVVVNPHKWLFVPFDLSAFYCRRMDVIRAAFSLVPEYLRTTDPGDVKNLMDTGIQLGRRFRSLKLWMVLRYFGQEGMRAHCRAHAAGAPVCRVGGRGPRVRAHGAGADERRVFPRRAAWPRAHRGRARATQRDAAGPGQRFGRSVPLPHEARRPLRAEACGGQPADHRAAPAPRVGPAEGVGRRTGGRTRLIGIIGSLDGSGHTGCVARHRGRAEERSQ